MKNNPYSLMFGKRPVESISRDDQIEKITQAFSASQPSEQVFMITGVRGSGKTVLLTDIASQFQQDEQWIVIDLNTASELIEDLAYKLEHRMRSAASLLDKASLSVSVKGINVSLQNPGAHSSSAEVAIMDMLEKVKKQGKRLLVTIDDVAGSQNMRKFAVTFQGLIRQDLPIYLLMTGLFEQIDDLQNMDNLTFLHRAEKIIPEPLNRRMMALSYQSTLKMSEDTALRMADMTCGYSYAFQVLGYFLWETGGDFDAAKPKFRAYLFGYVYDKIWSELTATEKQVLYGMVMAQSGRVKEIRDALHFNSNKFTVYRTRLIKKGLIVSNYYGHLIFSMPLFAEYVDENYYEE